MNIIPKILVLVMTLLLFGCSTSNHELNELQTKYEELQKKHDALLNSTATDKAYLNYTFDQPEAGAETNISLPNGFEFQSTNITCRPPKKKVCHYKNGSLCTESHPILGACNRCGCI